MWFDAKMPSILLLVCLLFCFASPIFTLIKLCFRKLVAFLGEQISAHFNELLRVICCRRKKTEDKRSINQTNFMRFLVCAIYYGSFMLEREKHTHKQKLQQQIPLYILFLLTRVQTSSFIHICVVFFAVGAVLSHFCFYRIFKFSQWFAEFHGIQAKLSLFVIMRMT